MRVVVGIAAALACALAGCQAVKPVEEMSYTELKGLRQQLIALCAQQGAPIGSPEHRPCMEQEVRRVMAESDNEAARQRAVAARSRNCVSNVVGNSVITNCF